MFNRIGIHQHSDLKGEEVALNSIKKQGDVLEVDLGSNMYSLISKSLCNFSERVSSSVARSARSECKCSLVFKLQSIVSTIQHHH